MPSVILGFNAWSEGKKPKVPTNAFIRKSISGWSLIVDVNEEGKLIMSATKNIGKTGSGWNEGEEANIKIQLQTINGRIPEFRNINPDYNSYTASPSQKCHLEINDKLGKVSESFKEELGFYERQWPGSSILEINEFLLSLVPNFKSLLEDQKLDEYVSSIIEEAADVTPTHKKGYTKAEHIQVTKINDNKDETINKLQASVEALTGVNESLRAKLETENKTGLYQ